MAGHRYPSHVRCVFRIAITATYMKTVEFSWGRVRPFVSCEAAAEMIRQCLMASKNAFELTTGESLYLDFVRGMAAQAVVVGHGLSLFHIVKLLHPPNVPWMQDIAVLVFFVLSGFVIPWSVQRKLESQRGYGVKLYVADRFSRIYTAYVPAIIFVIVIDSLSRQIDLVAYRYGDAFSVQALLGNLLMLQDYPFLARFPAVACTSFGSARPFWTLAVEWWIYLFYGYVVIYYMRLARPRILDVMTFIVLAIVPFANAVGGRGNGLMVYWLFGVAGFLLYPQLKKSSVSKSFQSLVLALCVIAAALRTWQIGMIAYDPLFALFVAIVIFISLSLLSGLESPAWLARLIRLNASVSYTLYLIHYSVLDFLGAHFGDVASPYVLCVVGFALSNVVAIAIGSVTEGRLTRVVRRHLHRCIVGKQFGLQP